ncbi:uncharacterized protein LOC126837514 isoform X2 [Adelges cooleyi]|uniref:uncharacterized protein LOC126837514 isoform X2 n=1 Tax=Adelges cooleyi TaxID=133065 RepID=UPI0021800D5C|nr:uncharacterized protein LOC126837514 isoform X2 [Adelges cooleyi]
MHSINQHSKRDPSTTSPIRHEVRFTKFEVFVNQSFGEVIEAAYKQYYEKQVLDVHMKFHTKVVLARINYELVKCREHYIDCVNVRTFDVVNICDNYKAFTFFYKGPDVNPKVSCELNGDYISKNFTYNMNHLVPLIAAPSEKWWEQSFKCQSSYYDGNNNLIIKIISENEFITFRMRNP